MPKLIIVLSIVSLLIPGSRTRAIEGPGRVCNRSSITIWLTVDIDDQWFVYSLPPGDCTPWTYDTEAIWGKACDDQRCWYQTWKVGATLVPTYVDDSAEMKSESPVQILYVHAPGLNSGWVENKPWPAPTLEQLDYGLERPESVDPGAAESIVF
jgi:hypothetical protein